VTTDLSNGPASGETVTVPKPTCIKSRRTAGPVDLASPSATRIAIAGSGSGRATARETLLSALSGVRLGSRDRQFLSRLVGWDKRNAVSVASLLWRARQAGREEAALTPRQLEVVLAALSDAALYRGTGAASAGCWDCDKIPGGRCSEHARDNDRARAYAEVAAALSTTPQQAGNVVLTASSLQPGLPADELVQPRGLGGYRHRASVAS
jgi:hypothetical protein